jgi:hypothetical protein
MCDREDCPALKRTGNETFQENKAAVRDCRAHAVDWRRRCLTAEWLGRSLRDERDALAKRVRELQGQCNSVDEALNSGDGSYKP